MILLSEPQKAAPVECPYLDGRFFVQDYFFAENLDDFEFGVLLASGWRRFGKFFFRPNCPDCRQCIPIRVDAEALTPTKSQKRVLKKGSGITMEALPPNPSEEAWQVYRSHSQGQFGKNPDEEDFRRTFYDPAVPALQTEYRVDGELMALGFLDVGSDGFSSAYFAFDPAYRRLSPGTLSVFYESTLARQNGRRWYYLGYWVPGCPSMDYKARFAPHQLYDWDSEAWVESSEHSQHSVVLPSDSSADI